MAGDQGVDDHRHPPHVVQNAAWLTGANGNTTFVVYSLGNFINAPVLGRQYHRCDSGRLPLRKRPSRTAVQHHDTRPEAALRHEPV